MGEVVFRTLDGSAPDYSDASRAWHAGLRGALERTLNASLDGGCPVHVMLNVLLNLAEDLVAQCEGHEALATRIADGFAASVALKALALGEAEGRG